MSLRINTNIPSLSAQRNLSVSQKKLETTMKQLSTGERFADLSEGPGDFAVSEHLRGQIRGQKAARTNAENAISYVQVAEGGLNEQNNILIRLRELAIQSASDTYSDTEREMMQVEFGQLVEEFDRIAKSTKFGANELLSGKGSAMEFQVGPYAGSENVVKYSSGTNTTAGELDLEGLEVADKYDARDSIETIDEALTQIASARASFGAIQSRLDSVTNNSSIQIENLEAARSRLADTDFAAAASEVFKQQALQQYQISVLAQANQFPQSVLRLLA